MTYPKKMRRPWCGHIMERGASPRPSKPRFARNAAFARTFQRQPYRARTVETDDFHFITGPSLFLCSVVGRRTSSAHFQRSRTGDFTISTDRRCDGGVAGGDKISPPQGPGRGKNAVGPHAGDQQRPRLGAEGGRAPTWRYGTRWPPAICAAWRGLGPFFFAQSRRPRCRTASVAMFLFLLALGFLRRAPRMCVPPAYYAAVTLTTPFTLPCPGH